MIARYNAWPRSRQRRSYDFGASLGKAIQSWDSDKTVAIVASGGLTHFVVE